MLADSLPLPKASAASSYFIKPGRGIFLLFSLGKTPTMPRELIPVSAWSLIRNVLGSRLSLRATNSPRKGSNLWGAREGLAPARRRAQRRPRYGCHSLTKGDDLTSRRR